jgi:hypothetical protein
LAGRDYVFDDNRICVVLFRPQKPVDGDAWNRGDPWHGKNLFWALLKKIARKITRKTKKKQNIKLLNLFFVK